MFVVDHASEVAAGKNLQPVMWQNEVFVGAFLQVFFVDATSY